MQKGQWVESTTMQEAVGVNARCFWGKRRQQAPYQSGAAGQEAAETLLASLGGESPAEVLWDRHTQAFGTTPPCHFTVDAQRGTLRKDLSHVFIWHPNYTGKQTLLVFPLQRGRDRHVSS